VRVPGGVEKMTAMACPHCGQRIDVVAPADPRRAIWVDGIPLLGQIPLDRNLQSQEREFDRIAEELVTRLEAA